MKIEYETNLEEFTRYINSVLRKNDKVTDWAFTIDTSLNNNLVLRIDYIKHFHSRTIFNMVTRDVEQMKMEFDWYFEHFLEELEGLNGK